MAYKYRDATEVASDLRDALDLPNYGGRVLVRRELIEESEFNIRCLVRLVGGLMDHIDGAVSFAKIVEEAVEAMNGEVRE